MITYFAGLKSSRQKKSEKQYREYSVSVLEILLSSSRVEVISGEEQKSIFGKGYSYQPARCSVYERSEINYFRIS